MSGGTKREWYIPAHNNLRRGILIGADPRLLLVVLTVRIIRPNFYFIGIATRMLKKIHGPQGSQLILTLSLIASYLSTSV